MNELGKRRVELIVPSEDPDPRSAQTMDGQALTFENACQDAMNELRAALVDLYEEDLVACVETVAVGVGPVVPGVAVVRESAVGFGGDP